MATAAARARGLLFISRLPRAYGHGRSRSLHSSAVILLHSFFPSGHAAWWPHLERERKEEKGAVRWREGAMPTPTAGSGMWERGAQKVAPTPTPTRVSRTLGRFGRTSPSVRPHGGPLSRLVRPVAWQLARRSPHTTPCCCNARQGCHSQPTGRLRQGKSRRSAFRPSLCALSRPPLLNHISIATQRKASSIMQHPLRLSVYSAVHSVRLATVCM